MKRIRYHACPLCGSSKFSFFRTGDPRRHETKRVEFQAPIVWNRCDDCQHVFTEGYWDEPSLALLMKQVMAKQTPNHDVEKERLLSGRLIDRVITHGFGAGWMPNYASWLDIGYGNGSLLQTAKEYGFTAVGYDKRLTQVRGVLTFSGGIADVKPGKFSVISLADVLEHEPFPTDAISTAAKLLAADGVLFVSCPNMAAPAWEWLDDRNINPYWNEPEHYHNFTRERLFDLLKEVGFTPVHYGLNERYRLGMEVIAKRG